MGLGWVCELLNYIPHLIGIGEGYLLFINDDHFPHILYCRNCALHTVSKILGIFNMARGVFIFIIFVGKRRILLQVGFKDTCIPCANHGRWRIFSCLDKTRSQMTEVASRDTTQFSSGTVIIFLLSAAAVYLGWILPYHFMPM